MFFHMFLQSFPHFIAGPHWTSVRSSWDVVGLWDTAYELLMSVMGKEWGVGSHHSSYLPFVGWALSLDQNYASSNLAL